VLLPFKSCNPEYLAWAVIHHFTNTKRPGITR
jgi:hypothetical protein